MQPNWLESFILKWLIHENKGEKSPSDGSLKQELIQMYEIWAKCCLILNYLLQYQIMKVLGLTIYVTKWPYIENFELVR